MSRTLALARSSALHALDRAGALLTVGAEAGCLEARLVPDQFCFAEQIDIVAGFALRATLPLIGQAVDEREPVLDAEGLAARLAEAKAIVEALPDAPLVEHVVHRAGFADLVQPPDDYLARFALPNLWFHLAMAHAILRARGLPVGKADFDGLHGYPEGFSWVGEAD
ncbi:DUF1993 family protein [Limimaricola pyoseonensis]|uniref:DUF1993 domain-containing protein n=1 Tax=Limimaricola pyoseonensis TaxID=521013 RepID=A0A1G7G8I5_9RHOB|nr:DUF1993 family protein [Limimaricola pyoseonensis]SDE84407.1 hypothetical protein SAMN04488567_2776 [Limimaricola pyoseonensis]